VVGDPERDVRAGGHEARQDGQSALGEEVEKVRSLHAIPRDQDGAIDAAVRGLRQSAEHPNPRGKSKHKTDEDALS
jgi:hypothetical protein